MNYVVGALGFFVGLFLWSSIIGGLFATLPLERKAVKAGVIEKVNWAKIIVSILFATVILIISALFAKYFFYGALVAGVIILFSIGKLRSEALENFQRDHSRSNDNSTPSNPTES